MRAVCVQLHLFRKTIVMKTLLAIGAPAALILAATPAALAHPEGSIRADSHAPLGVMGDHTHKAGEWMVSYRFMRMNMDGNRIGTDSVTSDFIASNIANRFAPPPTLRVVPTQMTMDMHMVGVMYAPSDKITLMAMVNYLENEMDHITYQGMMGTNELGTFTTRTSGFGDTRVSALVSLNEGVNLVHATLGVSLPTGSIDESDDVLTPMNTRPTLTLPYPMQLGSGTFDPIAGLTWVNTQSDHWRVGAQATALLRLYDNDQDYQLGDQLQATSWVSYSPVPQWSFSARATAKTTGQIEGRDTRIGAPVQTANPDFHGGETLTAGVGANWAGQDTLAGHRFAAEFEVPLYRDLNGPQMETDWQLTLGWQFAFGGSQ